MQEPTALYVGLEVHKDSISVLTPVYVPSVEDEAVRDLCWAREAARDT